MGNARLKGILIAVIAIAWTNLRPGLRAQPLSVQISGRLLGYERIPERQTDNEDSDRCRSAEPKSFARAFLNQRSKDKILVGMGDNFAPYLDARQMHHSPAGDPPAQGALSTAESKELFSWSGGGWVFQPKPVKTDQGKEPVPFDNVGCFLRRAGFDAVVPGKHDFHFGAERLRELARYLSSTGKPAAGEADNQESPVVMLGTNIVIRTELHVKPDPDAAGGSGLDVKTKTTIQPTDGAERDISFQLPATVLPWMRTWLLANTGGAIDKGCVVNVDKQPKKLSNCSEIAIQLDASGYGKAGTRLRIHSGDLLAGHKYRACAEVKVDLAPKAPFFCSAEFTVAQPFFQFPASGPLGSEGAYTMSSKASAEPVAIFGVVDPNLTGYVGKLNDSWLNSRPEYDTYVQIADPKEALQQALDACHAVETCWKAKKILLAQMTRADAEALALHFRKEFDLVISQVDADFASADGEVTVPVGERRLLVLTPRDQYASEVEDGGTDEDRPHLIGVSVQTVEIAPEPGYTRFRLSHSGPDRVPIPGGPPSPGAPLFTSRLETKFKNFDLTKESQKRAVFEELTLIEMRNACHSEVSLLQHRDLYLSGIHLKTLRFADPEAQEILDRIYWKGDLVICHEVTGAILTKVLGLSDKFDAQDKDPLSPPGAYDQGLARLGVDQDRTLKWVINGTAVDPNKLYSVATTDYLAAGDTGYPDLGQTIVPPDRRLKDYEERTTELATLVCLALAPKENCHRKVLPDRYLDHLQTLSVTEPNPLGASGFQNPRSWYKQNLKIVPLSASGVEEKVQQDGVWNVTLSKSDFGLKWNVHSLSEGDRLANFAGVDTAQVTAKQERDITFDWSYRITHWGHIADFYSEGDASYSDTNTRTPSATSNKTDYDIVNIVKNTWGQETGYTFHLYPGAKKSATGIRATASARMESQVLQPVQQFSLKNNEGNYTFDQNRHIPRTYYLFAKLGLRYQGRKSWFESGVALGEKFRRPVEYEWLNANGSIAFACTLAAPPAISKSAQEPCPSKLIDDFAGADPHFTFRDKRFAVATINGRQDGYYLNFSINGPQIKGVMLTAANQGQYFWNKPGDRRVDTKYFDDLTLSAAVPLFGSIKISPQIDIFAFRSKFDHEFNTGGWHMHGYQTSVTLSYCFDHDSGVPWTRAFRYDSCGISKK
jgi:hypothetical protein